MKPVVIRSVVLCTLLCTAAQAGAQTPVGALAIDERQGDQWGWAVDYETAAAARQRALSECGSGCSVVLTFERCAAYAADQDETATAYGWAESYAVAEDARQRALTECSSRRGSGCTVRVWGCNGPVVEEGLGLDQATRREIQQGLQAAGFDPGVADGTFGRQTRASIRAWQTSRGSRATGYLDGASLLALRPAGPGQTPFRQRAAAVGAPSAGEVPPAPAVQPLSSPSSSPPAANAELEALFWQSIMNSTNPAELEAYLSQFPNGVFRALAEARMSALRGSAGAAPAPASSGAAGSRVSGIPDAGLRTAAAVVDARPRPGAVFRPDRTCAGQPAGSTCWQEISRQPGCHVWNQNRQPGSVVTWTGECAGGLAEGTGTLTWVWDDNRQTLTGRLQGGKHTGFWILRHEDGGVSEGLYVDSERNGHWVLRFANGTVEEGPFVDGERNGHWVMRGANGTVGEGPYVGGELHGTWVMRQADGTVGEGPYVGGARNGTWVYRWASGGVSELEFVNGEEVSRRRR